MTDAYARAGVDTAEAARAVDALVAVLRSIESGRESRVALPPGHYATVLEIAPGLGLALCIDGVGSKVILAEQAGRFDTVGIDCVAMNANDLVCVGAEPVALLDYLAVERADPDMLEALGRGLKAGAELAGVEIPGGELAQLPELIKGHPSPNGFDLCASCIGLVPLDRMITGQSIEPGDAIIGIPSSGVHSNGLTLARNVLSDLKEAPPELGGRTVADELLEPTVIYVRAVLELIASEVEVRGLAHITGDGFLNLTRLHAPVGYRIDAPLPVPPVFRLVQELAEVGDAEMHEVFNMGCGFCAVVPAAQADAAVELLSARHPGTARIGWVTGDADRITVPSLGLIF
jgi:phosphoribosylformylglycinamidine cyclo-ligase